MAQGTAPRTPGPGGAEGGSSRYAQATKGGSFAPAGATKGLSGRPLETFGENLLRLGPTACFQNDHLGG